MIEELALYAALIVPIALLLIVGTWDLNWSPDKK